MDNNLANFLEIWKKLIQAYPNERTYKYLIYSFVAYKVFQELFLPATKESVCSYYKRIGFNFLKALPKIGPKINSEIEKTKIDINESLMKIYKNEEFLQILPNGMDKKEILKLLKHYQTFEHINWKESRMSGAVYLNYSHQDQLDLMRDVFVETAYSNPLHVDVFPEIRKMEAEICKITINLFNGDEKAVASVTSGGTESIILACKAYRDYARFNKNIKNPTMLVPISAHAAFDKAAQLLDIEIIHIPLDPKTYQVDIKKMKKKINKNVCLLVGSSPNYPHGLIDPIDEISKLGVKYDIPVHVDSCLGGFLVPFVSDAGFTMPLVDFRLPGVTSISADTHKYAFAPKGTSVLMFRKAEYRHHQFFVVGEWQGGIYATSTIAGSRAGSAVATCWASLLHYGHNGYVQSTKAILETAEYIRESLKNVEGLFIYGDPKLSVIALGSNDFNIYQLSNELHKLGWSLNPIQNPSGFHICVTSMHTVNGIKEKLVDDIISCTRTLLEDTENKLDLGPQAAMYGMAEAVPDKSLINVFVNQYLDSYYSTNKTNL